MSALHSLGLDGAFGNPSILGDGVSLHQWVINIIKENNLTSNSVTNGLLHDLLARLVMKHHRHAQHDPKRQLTKAHIAHIFGVFFQQLKHAHIWLISIMDAALKISIGNFAIRPLVVELLARARKVRAKTRRE